MNMILNTLWKKFYQLLTNNLKHYQMILLSQQLKKFVPNMTQLKLKFTKKKKVKTIRMAWKV
jgi:hypothetical protein